MAKVSKRSLNLKANNELKMYGVGIGRDAVNGLTGSISLEVEGKDKSSMRITFSEEEMMRILNHWNSELKNYKK